MTAPVANKTKLKRQKTIPDSMKLDFLRYRIIDKLKLLEIAKKLGIRGGQVDGIAKLHREGKLDYLLPQILQPVPVAPTPEPTPIPEPVPEPAPPEPTPVEPPVPEPTPVPPEPAPEVPPTPEPAPEPPVPPIEPPTPPPDDPDTSDISPDTPDQYTPEGNVDPSGKVQSDPACKIIFTLVSSPDDTPPGTNIDRMKRTAVYDKIISAAYTFDNSVRDATSKEVVPLTEAPSNAMLWDGEITIRMSVNELVCIPMPAADSELMEGWTATCPATGSTVILKWFKDAYGCYRAATGTSLPGRVPVKIKFRAVCPVLKKHYWQDVKKFEGIKLPQAGHLDDAIPPELYAVAKEMADILGLDKNSGLIEVITKLGAYCSSFGCDNIPPGDMTIESFKAKQGACRTRALDFFIVANYLGVACRYPVSDCHAFIELLNPKTHEWAALDLGGCDPGGPRNPNDLNPPEEPKPSDPSPKLPPPPERPEDKRQSIRELWRQIPGATETDIKIAWLACKKSGG